MPDESTRRVFPGEIRQAGHVVADLDSAIDEWVAVGVGPWTVIEVTQRGGTYLGDTSEAILSIGFANTGPLQIELIQVHDEQPSVWQAARDADQFGLHHLAYWAEDFDGAMQRVEQRGLALVQSGDGNGIARFVYVASKPGGMLIEIMELNEMSRAFMDDVRVLSQDWDGSGPPVRR